MIDGGELFGDWWLPVLTHLFAAQAGALLLGIALMVFAVTRDDQDHTPRNRRPPL